jgi:ethanolamine utilization protein EutN
MRIAKVMGAAVATLKHDSLQSTKLLLLNPADVDGAVVEKPFVAVDLVGAGAGELVLVSEGSSARMATGYASSAADAAVVGILDSLEYEGTMRFRKE